MASSTRLWPDAYARSAVAQAEPEQRERLRRAWETVRERSRAGDGPGARQAWRRFVELLDAHVPDGAIRFGMHPGNAPVEAIGRPDALPAAVLFDMDGTLTDVSGVRHYVRRERRRRNYAKFHRASAVCPPVPQVLAAARECRHAVVVVTARSEEFRVVTAGWLRKWRVPYAELRMRAERDFRPDREVKEEILAELRRRWRIVHAWDDNPPILELWRSHGVPVTEVPGWDEPIASPESAPPEPVPPEPAPSRRG